MLINYLLILPLFSACRVLRRFIQGFRSAFLPNSSSTLLCKPYLLFNLDVFEISVNINPSSWFSCLRKITGIYSSESSHLMEDGKITSKVVLLWATMQLQLSHNCRTNMYSNLNCLLQSNQFALQPTRLSKKLLFSLVISSFVVSGVLRFSHLYSNRKYYCGWIWICDVWLDLNMWGVAGFEYMMCGWI